MFQAFDRAVADALDFVVEDFQHGVKLIQDKGVFKASWDEITYAVEGAEASIATMEHQALASCAAPCVAPERATIVRMQGSQQVLSGGGSVLPLAEVANRFGGIRTRDPVSARCFDCGSQHIEAADLSFGVFVCGHCYKFHRGLTCDVRHCIHEPWTDYHLRALEHGGNGQLLDFFKANHITGDAQKRYFTSAAVWYREAWLKCSANGWPVPPPPQGIAAPAVTAGQGGLDGAAAFEAPVEGEEIRVEQDVKLTANTNVLRDADQVLEGEDLLMYEYPSKSSKNVDDLLDFDDKQAPVIDAPVTCLFSNDAVSPEPTPTDAASPLAAAMAPLLD